MITCSKCGAIHPDDSKFCDQCGEDLAVKCPICGASARPQAKFCPQCRKRLNGNAGETKIFKDNVIAGDVNASTNTTVVNNNYGPSFSDMEDAFCSECGEIIPGRLKFYNKCKDCGKNFCNKHLENQICRSCKMEGFLSPFTFEKRANNKYAILGLKNLNEISVEIPSFVESIENGAFEGSHIIRVAFHDGIVKIGNRAFANCKDLSDIHFPDSLYVIGEEAFYGCSNLNAEAPRGVRIGTNAFCGTAYDNLQREQQRKAEEARRQEELRKAEEARRVRDAEERRKVEEAQRIREAEEKRRVQKTPEKGEWESFIRTFKYEKIQSSGTYKITGVKDKTLSTVKIPEFVTEIGDLAFLEHRKLAHITLSNSMTSIGEGAFAHCVSLMNLTIPNSITNIGKSAFKDCKCLNSITISNSTTSISDYTFKGCTSLTSITIPNSVTSIGSSAFSGCMSLANITIPDSVTSIGSSAFLGCTSLTSITIPNSVMSIGPSAFRNTSLTSITIPNRVTSIGDCVFANCSNLQNITIPSSVTRIEDNAFKGCFNLENISIPDSVAEQGSACAQWLLGMAYLQREDYTQAVDWFLKAEYYGPALNALAFCYLNGRGVEKDLDKFSMLLGYGANHGSVDCQISMGKLFEEVACRRSDKEKLKEAEHWYRLAANQGIKEAFEAIERVQLALK